ncbi:MAG: 50S ribosomal protein L18Ae [Candidatus Bathyarchaeia archaeon]
MSEVKNFKIAGEIRKGKGCIPFNVQISALKQEHAMQRLYADMGSRHRARRFEIMVESVQEVNPEARAEENVNSSSK